MAGVRLLSHTEIASALSCPARHAFAYTGHLTGGQTLKSRRTPRILSEGRAWGSAVQRWHQRGDTLLGQVEAAEALRIALDAAEDEMFERGVTFDPGERLNVENHLAEVFSDYTERADPYLGLERIEHEVIVPIPSRTGRRSSTRYGFQCFLDGWTYDADGRPWLVEFKLRGKLSTVQMIQSSPQFRWYAWALRKLRGVDPVGVYVDERLNLAPGPARIVNARKKGEGIEGRTVSHASDQVTTGQMYLEACAEYGVEPVMETFVSIESRVWQQRVPIIFRKGELDEAGQELVSAAKFIRDLDSGEMYPIRNASPMTCGMCRFKSICPDPDDEMFVDMEFERRVPKRLKESDEPDVRATPEPAGPGAAEHPAVRPAEDGQDHGSLQHGPADAVAQR